MKPVENGSNFLQFRRTEFSIATQTRTNTANDRRDVIMAGAGALAALAGLGVVAVARAQDATPTVSENRDLTN